MAVQTYRANVATKTIPLLTEDVGRTIIVGGQDQYKASGLSLKADTEKDIANPQVYYCHNAMPTSYGIKTIGYTQVVSPLDSVEFIEVFDIRDTTGPDYSLGFTSDGRIYSRAIGGSVWSLVTTRTDIIGKLITVAQVQGTSYIFFEGIGCYKFTSGSFVAVTLTGLTVADIIGILAAAGYLLAWSASEIAWCSTVDVTDFTPSTTTGAGGGSIEECKGDITICAPFALGMIIYTKENAVAAVASGNVRYPWNFRELYGAGGLEDVKLLTYELDGNSQYAYTTSGLQTVSPATTSIVYPEVTDFLAGGKFEDFNEATLSLEITDCSSPMKKAVATVANRYLILSYGISSLTHAWVLDTALKRWGKLKIPHVQCFEWKSADIDSINTPRKSLAFLQSNGAVQLVDFDNLEGASGVVITGKYQYVRTRLLSLEKVEVEGISLEDDFTLYADVSINGKTRSKLKQGYETLSVEGLRVFNFHDEGKNHSLVMIGAFNLNSLVISFVVSGRR